MRGYLWYSVRKCNLAETTHRLEQVLLQTRGTGQGEKLHFILRCLLVPNRCQACFRRALAKRCRLVCLPDCCQDCLQRALVPSDAKDTEVSSNERSEQEKQKTHESSLAVVTVRRIAFKLAKFGLADMTQRKLLERWFKGGAVKKVAAPPRLP